MNDETFTTSIREFLKTVGINSQLEIERAVNTAVASGAATGKETFPARMTLHIVGIDLHVDFDGEIKLE